RLARVGLPSALIGMMFSLVYLAFCRSAGRFGPASLAVIVIATRIEASQFVVGSSIGMAGATLVGQNLGAGRPERATAAIRTGLTWCIPVSVALAILIAAWPAWFLTLFPRDA